MGKRVDIQMNEENKKTEYKFLRFFNKKIVAFSVFLLMIICVSAVFAAGRCVPCRANHYCQGGVPIMCPAEKPVTNGTGGVTEADCMSCTTRNGAGNPFFGGYNLGVGLECTSCAEDNEDTPFWNGSACVSCVTANAGTPVWNGSSCEACPENTAWDGTTCAENETPNVDWAFTIPHGDSTIYIAEKAVYADYKDFAPCLYEGLANCDSFKNTWMGANLYCQSKGLRLPTTDEFISIMNATYGVYKKCSSQCSVSFGHCTNVDASETGCCGYSDIDVNAPANQELYNYIASEIIWWSSAECNTDDALRYEWETPQIGSGPKEGAYAALCITTELYTAVEP